MTFIIFMTLAVALLLMAEYKHLRWGVWVSKPLASTIFLLYALSEGVPQGAYGYCILLALGFSWIGDVLLIRSESKAFFQGGLVSFLLGHVAYGVAFGKYAGAVNASKVLAAMLVLGVIGALVVRWLIPYVKAKDPKMLGPVWAYVIVISVMVSCAVGVASHNPLIPVGAFLFYLSDLSVARDQFVNKSFVNKAWGLPFYYAAQMILASTMLPQ